MMSDTVTSLSMTEVARLPTIVRAVCKAQRHPDPRVKEELIKLRRTAVKVLTDMCKESRWRGKSAETCVLLTLLDVLIHHSKAKTKPLVCVALSNISSTDMRMNDPDEYRASMTGLKFVCQGPEPPDQDRLRYIFTCLLEINDPELYWPRKARKRSAANLADHENAKRRKTEEEASDMEDEQNLPNDESKYNPRQYQAARKNVFDWLVPEAEELLDTVLGVMDVETYGHCLQKVVHQLSARSLPCPEKLLSATHVLRCVVDKMAGLADQHKAVTLQAVRKVWLSMLTVEEELKTNALEGRMIAAQTDRDNRLWQALLRTRALVLEHMDEELTLAPSTLTMCYQSCHLALHPAPPAQNRHTSDPELIGRSLRMARVFGEVYRIAHTMITKYADIVMDTLPAYSSLLQVMLKSLLDHCEEPNFFHMRRHHQEAANQIVRLVSSLCSHKAEMSKVSPYLLSSFVTYLHNANPDPQIKRCLESAVHGLLSVCSEHGVSLLFTTLAPGPRIRLQQLHHDYTKFHKYTGSV